MKLLAVDTATQTCSVALAEDGRILHEYTAEYAETHARRVMAMIDDVLVRADTLPGEVDGFAVTVGPGSFTGLRIGISTVKGLATALSKPVVGILTLEALAHNLAGTSGLIAPWIDARKKEVYTAVYRLGDGWIETVQPPRVGPPAEALRDIDEPCSFVGNGAELYRDEIEKARGESAVIPAPALNRIRACRVAHIGFRLFRERSERPPGEIQPVYIRRSDAERHAKIPAQTC